MDDNTPPEVKAFIDDVVQLAKYEDLKIQNKNDRDVALFMCGYGLIMGAGLIAIPLAATNC
jgi:hypothetical protein